MRKNGSIWTSPSALHAASTLTLIKPYSTSLGSVKGSSRAGFNARGIFALPAQVYNVIHSPSGLYYSLHSKPCFSEVLDVEVLKSACLLADVTTTTLEGKGNYTH